MVARVILAGALLGGLVPSGFVPDSRGAEPLNADFRGRDNNQAFGGQAPWFSGDFFPPVPRPLIVFPAQRGSVGFVSAFAEP